MRARATRTGGGSVTAPRRLVRLDAPTHDPELVARLGGRGHWLWVGGPLPRRADGFTFGSLVIVRRRAASAPGGFERLLHHEQVHVAQFREQGVARFVWCYVRSYVGWRLRGYDGFAAYRRIPFEIEARYLSSAALARSRQVASGPHRAAPGLGAVPGGSSEHLAPADLGTVTPRP